MIELTSFAPLFKIKKRDMKSIAIIYGSSTENTKSAAEKIAEQLSEFNTTLVDVAEASEEEFTQHDVLILGTSTWGIGELQDDWEGFFPTFKNLNLSGKTVAFFGLGDCEGYPDSFVSGMGILHEVAIAQGATIIGQVTTSDYEFDDSDAVKDGQFIGLPLDEDNESDKTDARIQDWCAALKKSLN